MRKVSQIHHYRSIRWFWIWDYWNWEWRTPRMDGNYHTAIGPLRIVYPLKWK